tara:strand:- start:157 stop:666 length:510 start_codon:yes stop_codon:yes gene_type:complete
MRHFIIFALFAFLTIFSLYKIIRMKLANDEALELPTFRLHFFLMSVLMAICILLFWWFQLMELRGWLGPLVVTVVNVLGFILSYIWARTPPKSDAGSKSVRVYNIYFRGQRLGAVTRNDFDKLMALGLLKKQQTVELVDDYEAQASGKGVTVSLLSNSDGTERLVKVDE